MINLTNKNRYLLTKYSFYANIVIAFVDMVIFFLILDNFIIDIKGIYAFIIFTLLFCGYNFIVHAVLRKRGILMSDSEFTEYKKTLGK